MPLLPAAPPGLGAAPMLAPAGPPGMPMGAPPMMAPAPQYPSLDPAALAQALAPVQAMRTQDEAAFQAQQDAAMASVLQMMRQMPNPAAQAAMVEPGAPTSPLQDSGPSGLAPDLGAAPAGSVPPPDGLQ